MTKESIRRVQFTCFALAHVPLFALLAYALSDGIADHVTTVIVAFGATLVTAIALIAYLGRTLDANATSGAARF